MKNNPTGYVVVKNKKYPYSIQEVDERKIYFHCDGCLINQEYLKEDLAGLLTALPEMILDELEYQKAKKQKEAVLRFRVNQEEKIKIEKKAHKEGFASISKYLRSLALGLPAQPAK